MPTPKVATNTKVQQSNGPLWKGPYVDGITQSLLNLFLMCRERFRVKVIDGLGPTDRFKHAIEYGNMWHVCEEALAESGNPIVNNPVSNPPWLKALQNYANTLLKRYPTSQEEVEKWYLVCKMQFPVYVDYWKKHPDVKERTPLYQEEVFNVDYSLPSGRVVRLKGKFDSVDIIGKKPAIYLQENKSKGNIDEEVLQRQLTFDLQTMFYLVALKQWCADFNIGTPIHGIRYNVIRRPFAGGKGMIRQKQATKTAKEETLPQLIERLKTDYILPEPGYWFMRWKVMISATDTERFRDEFLTPILEQLCDWWDDLEKNKFAKSGLNYRTPYGIYNPLAEGLMTDVDEYLATGSTAGLQKLETLFPEL